jgi:16S rRNA (uracil1498-N3)-methyltransferase
VVIVVGPEGGVTREETVALLAAGARLGRLGPSVLRASTAGAVAAAVLLSRTARWA